MADKKVDATTGEVNEPMEDCSSSTPILNVHCKPVFNYQSVEFDCEIHINNFEGDLVSMETIYTEMLKMLVRVSENAPQREANKPAASFEEPASERQKQILRDFHIEFKPDITKKQAHNLIKKSMDQEIF